MNDSYKKEQELESLSYFLDAYEDLTHDPIVDIEGSERPDFICYKKSGEKIGVELTKIRRGHPESIQYDLIINRKKYM